MKVKIDKDTIGYTLEIQSGHFSGTLKNITRDSLFELNEELTKLLVNDQTEIKTLVWNPRSQRHEMI